VWLTLSQLRQLRILGQLRNRWPPQEQERKSSWSGKTQTIPKREGNEKETEKTGFAPYKTHQKEIVRIAPE
jgi:hypothetical protein